MADEHVHVEEVEENIVLFENQIEITEELYKKPSKPALKIRKAIHYCSSFSKVILLIGLIWYLVGAFIKWDSASYIVVAIMTFSLTFALVIVADKRKRRKLKKSGGETKRFRSFRFGEKYIEIKDNDIEIKLDYILFKYISESDEFFQLWYGIDYLTIYKNAFTIGTANEFLEFFIEKCSEKESLWTIKQQNFHLFKKLMYYIALLVALSIIIIYIVKKLSV